jgi:hypothetical protein
MGKTEKIAQITNNRKLNSQIEKNGKTLKDTGN